MTENVDLRFPEDAQNILNAGNPDDVRRLGANAGRELYMQGYSVGQTVDEAMAVRQELGDRSKSGLEMIRHTLTGALMAEAWDTDIANRVREAAQ
jgi:hypothetical protein